jgi:hypothetical protein
MNLHAVGYWNFLGSYQQLRSTGQVLTVGDFNYPEVNWDPMSSDSTGSKFLDLVQDLHLVQHMHKSTRENSILDLVLTSEQNMVEDLWKRNTWLTVTIIL